MDKKFERISYRKIPHLNLFLNRISFRSVHFHNEIELLCLFNGNCSVFMPDKTVPAKRGDVILINHNVAHEIRSENGADFVVIQFSRHTFNEYLPLLRTTFFDCAKVTEKTSEKDTASLWRFIHDLSRAYVSDFRLAPLYCVKNLSELIIFLYEKCPFIVYSQEQYDSKKKFEQRMQRIIGKINDDYKNKLLLNDIADGEGITIAHLSHLFHKQLGVTFRDYLNNLRFENALRLLLDESLNVSEIALNCGFSDVKYMTKMFKERFGRTPAQYRKRRRSADGGKTCPDEYIYGETESLGIIEELVRPLTF